MNNREDVYIIAIEIGSSHITGIAGKKMADGNMAVLVVYKEDSSAFIRKGQVSNPPKATNCIKGIIGKLQDHLNRPITQVYVGYCAMSLRSVFNSVSDSFDHDLSVTKEHLEDQYNRNLNMELGNNIIISTVPQDYVVGKRKVNAPEGELGDRLESRFMNIVMRGSIKTVLEQCFKDAGVQVAGYFITPMAEAEAMLTEDERRSGCALIDFGAQTTTLCIYKDSILRYIAVIPLGSANITKDLMSFSIEQDQAERLKLQYAVADFEELPAEQCKESYYQQPDGTPITHEMFADAVYARMKEILENVSYQVRESTITSQMLLGGVVVTGGGSNINRIQNAVGKELNLIKVRKMNGYDLKAIVYNKTVNDKYRDCPAALSIMLQGRENCCGEENGNVGVFGTAEQETAPAPAPTPEQIEDPKPPKPGLWSKMKGLFNKLGDVLEE